jgi:hypothetical protein
VAVIFKLLREGVREPRESPDSHSQIQILPLDIASRDVLPIRVSAQNASADSDALRGAVARVGAVIV